MDIYQEHLQKENVCHINVRPTDKMYTKIMIQNVRVIYLTMDDGKILCATVHI